MYPKKTIDLPLQNHSTHNLTRDEKSNPLLVIQNFFDFGHLPEVQQLMWQWFSCTVTGTFSKDLDKKERKNIVCIFEHLERLVEAAYLINEQRKLNERN